MLEVIATIARWFQLAANLILLGSCVFLFILSTDKSAFAKKWLEKLECSFPWLAITIPIGLLVIVFTTILQLTGNMGSLEQPDVWWNFLSETRVGQIWIGRFAFAVLLLIFVIYLSKVSRVRWHYMACAAVATLPLIANSFVSHSAAEDFSLITIAPYAFHQILAGIWFGALPALLLLLHTSRQYEDTRTYLLTAGTVKRFSAIAFPTMILIILTGIIVSDRVFEDQYAALVATRYGWLLSSKLALLGIILLIAWQVRSHWLPALLANEQTKDKLADSRNKIWKWVRIEFFLAFVLVLLATIISHTTPAKHTPIENWPFSFRFSIDATWSQPGVATQVWIGAAIVILALVVFKWGQFRNWSKSRLIIIPMVILTSGFAMALPPLTIKAHPETYRRSPVPFDTISIANGVKLYGQHCVDCHGIQGKGNGIKSRTLSTKLPDLLMELHVNDHTPGDFYHWISYGMVNTDMPGYADKIPEEDRWDLINFIHALSRGYQARILSPEVVVDKAFAKPPVFSYATHDGSHGALQDFRKNQPVLLVNFSWPQSQQRIEQLKLFYDKLREQNIALLAVPTRELTSEELTQITADLPFPIVIQGAEEITSSYALWRRTMNNPDIIGRGTVPDHLEFLIDRNGYLRARWIPSIDKSGWSDINMLIQQVSLLNHERLEIPFPEDSVY
ncbi:CopD family protein [Nitrosomonas sp.]|uniref:CopD family protein n=1 Tax=Nitrosomonas sp. TaxID=42353 RepID=UPI001D530BD0|nr:CopD family protein [Nitrosomonas sp.]MBX3616454.1 CopD family protein [Nitrosomonas sp.]